MATKTNTPEELKSMTIYEILSKIQVELDAPKNNYNSFGKYKYRSCEDILYGLKPLCSKYGVYVLLNDEIVISGNRFYVKATAEINNGKGESLKSTAYAREDENKKGMDSAQVTGSSSSYARKYALNGLFAIDDGHDADCCNNTKPNTAQKNNAPSVPDERTRAVAMIAKLLGMSEKQAAAEVKNRYNIPLETADIDTLRTVYKTIESAARDRPGAPAGISRNTT
jgi:hypothetical protein